jgi:hypothetical protein
VDKEVVAKAEAAGEVFKEFYVVLRDGVPDASYSFVLVEKRDFGGINSVALEAFSTPKAEPVGDKRSFTGEDTKQDLLVVTENEDRLDAAAIVGPETFKDVGGTGAPVDEISDEDQQGAFGRTVLNLGMNLREQVLK